MAYYKQHSEDLSRNHFARMALQRQVYSYPPFFYLPEEEDYYDWRIPGSMQRPSFSALAHGKMFLDRTQAQLHQPRPTPEEDEETRKLCEIPSILDFPNRRALARQGFYGKIYNSTTNQPPEPRLKRTVSASEKRKQFHSGKTKINWSLTDESEEGSSSGQADRTASVDSWDRGLVLKSFSDRFSSDSSFESNDSFGEQSNERQLVKQNSISHLREQYNQTIMKSMDQDVPVFNDEDPNSPPIQSNKRKVSLGDIRKQQVNRLMTSLDDDGDYFAHSLQSSMKENSLRPTLIAAQKSTQSTLTGSPVSPNDLNFSFEKGLNDGEGEFDFKNEKPEKLMKSNKQSVSIIVEEDVESVKSFDSRETTHRDGNELAPLHLTVRSDSCNTLVPQDSNFDGDGVEGELTPRPRGLSPGLSPSPNNFEINLISGDALSESTGSSTTLSTVIHDQLDADILEQGERSRSLEENTKSRSIDDNNMLKPKPCPAQESFELEEISSAEDWNGNVTKSFIKKGPLEKSASTHSDSSGFADLDTVGETTLSSIDTGKDQSSLLHSKFRSAKTSAQQQGNPAFRLAENTDMVKKKNLINLTAVNVSKNSSSDLIKENNDPRLQSINFFPIEKASEKSLVYTVNVPLSPVIENDTPKCSERFRYISTLSVKFGDSSEDDSHKQGSTPKVMKVGPLTFKRVRSVDDLDPEEIERDASRSDNGLLYTSDTSKSHNHSGDSKEIVSADNNFPDVRTFNRLNYSENGKKSLRDKEKVLEKKRAKDALISAKSHTADWLLRQYGSQNISQTGERGDENVNSQFKLGRPAWASTPNLKAKRNLKKDDMQRSRRIMPQSQSSFDLILDETSSCNDQTSETNIYRNQQNFSRSMEHFDQTHIDESDLKHDLDELESRQRLAELRGDSNFSSLDESVDVSRPSLIGSSSGLPEDQINYIRLARLVNGPSLMADISKMPNSRFTPNFHMKNWTHLSKRKHLEEETLLMQHAVQRYKTELCLMENMLFALYKTAQEELGPEDRMEVEELQQLWVEVRKEVIKMEELLSQRLKSIMQGNDYYNPLDALEIVQSMIDLLREQLYHQQMSIARDLDFANDDLDLEPSVRAASTRSSVSGSWMNDISSQVSELKSSIASAEQQQKRELQEQIAELKTSLLSEVKSDICDTQNTKMLQLQLQAREAEIRRLKMELLLQNVGTGKTRKIQTLESDV